MRPLQYTLTLLFLSGCSALASPTHLDISIPDRESSNFFGLVKKVTTEYNYDMSDRKYKEIRHYDEAGNLQSCTRWNSRGEIIYTATNSFNEAGCLVRQQIEDIREKTTHDYEIVLNIPTRKMAYQCRITGDVEVVSYDKKRRHISTTIKKRNGKTRPINFSKRTPDQRKQQYTRYDEKGRVKYVIAYDWNDQRQIERTAVSYKQGNQKSLNEYNYLNTDEAGNWTQCLLKNFDLQNNKEKRFEKLSTRTFEYYENPQSGNEI